MTIQILPANLARPLLSQVFDLAPTAVDAVACAAGVVVRQTQVPGGVGLTALRVAMPNPLHETVLQVLILGCADEGSSGGQTS